MSNSVSRDVKYPFAGDTITLRLEEPDYNITKFWLVSKPFNSKLELFNACNQNYLPSVDRHSAKFTPDIDGTYELVAEARQTRTNAPHFNGDGGVGQSKGIESIVASTQSSFKVYVGHKITRDIGFYPDSCKFVAYATTAIIGGQAIDGLLTYRAVGERAPRLENGTTDAAKIAMNSPAVVSQIVGSFGGFVDDSTHYSGTEDVIEVSSVVPSNLFTDLAWLIYKVNSHMASVGNLLWVHLASDTATTISAANCTVGDAASQVALINSLRAALTAHAGKLDNVHAVADTVSVFGYSVDCPANASLDDRLKYAIDVERFFNTHRLVVANDISKPYATGTRVHGGQHGTPGDVILPYDVEPKTEADLVAVLNEVKERAGYHFTRASVELGGVIHSSSPTALLCSVVTPGDADSYISAVNSLLSVFGAHVMNKDTNGGDAAYHDDPDDLNSVAKLPRAGSFADAVQLHELLVARFQAHSSTGHFAVGHGRCFWDHEQSGIGKLHEAFDAQLKQRDFAPPANSNTAVSTLVGRNGFSRA